MEPNIPTEPVAPVELVAPVETQPSAPAEPTAPPVSEAKPSFLERIVSRVRGTDAREGDGTVQEPEPWRAMTRDEYTRHVQSLKDQGAFESDQRTRRGQITDAERELDTALADGYDPDIAAATKKLTALRRGDAEAMSQDEILLRHGARIVDDYDKETIAVWIDKLGLDDKSFHGKPRPAVSEDLLTAAMEYGAAQVLDEIMENKTDRAKSARLALWHEFQGTDANNEPVHIEGTVPARPPDGRAALAGATPIPQKQAAWDRRYPGIPFPSP